MASPRNKKLSWGLRLTLPLLFAAALAPLSATAQTPLCDGLGAGCEGLRFDFDHIQRIPAIFRFQTKIAQRKFPRGDESFPQLTIVIGEPGQVLCRELFREIQLEDHILNLEIGRNIDCELEEVLAENPRLRVQICFGPESCLEPIPLIPVPYAASASFATEAERARRAHRSAQSHYAHRMTADQNLMRPREIGYGYFDFHSPSEDRGSIQWGSVRGAGENNLHIAGADAAGAPTRLSTLTLDARETQIKGLARVNQGGAEINGAVSQRGSLHIENRLSSPERLEVSSGDLEVSQTLTVRGEQLRSAGQLVIESPHVSGVALRTASTLTVTGALTTLSDLIIHSALTLPHFLRVLGDLSVASPTSVRRTLRVEEQALLSSLQTNNLRSESLSLDQYLIRGNIGGRQPVELAFEALRLSNTVPLEIRVNAAFDLARQDAARDLIARANDALFMQRFGHALEDLSTQLQRVFRRGPSGFDRTQLTGRPVRFSGRVTFEERGYQRESRVDELEAEALAAEGLEAQGLRFRYWSPEAGDLAHCNANPEDERCYGEIVFAGDQCGNGRRANCACGNGTTEPEIGEECDDGNVVATDACTSTCQNAACGDEIIHDGVESCDNGAENSAHHRCTPDCQDARCGDGFVYDLDGGLEECDDGDDNNSDNGDCTTSCFNAACGDGLLHNLGSGTETCDAGADNSEHGDCTTECQIARCGDGFLWNQGAGTERCDDGNGDLGDGCVRCQPARCGDGELWRGREQCDNGAGNRPHGVARGGECRAAECTVAFCGDHRIDADETCDDGNNDHRDNCEACQLRCANITKAGHFEGRFRREVRASTRNQRSSGTSCGGGGPQVAYEIRTGERPRYLIAETFNADYDTYLHLRQGQCERRDSLVCNDDGGPGNNARITRWLEAGNTYFVILDGFIGRSGSSSLRLQTFDCDGDLPLAVTQTLTDRDFEPVCRSVVEVVTRTIVEAVETVVSFFARLVGIEYRERTITDYVTREVCDERRFPGVAVLQKSVIFAEGTVVDRSGALGCGTGNGPQVAFTFSTPHPVRLSLVQRDNNRPLRFHLVNSASCLDTHSAGCGAPRFTHIVPAGQTQFVVEGLGAWAQDGARGDMLLEISEP